MAPCWARWCTHGCWPAPTGSTRFDGYLDALYSDMADVQDGTTAEGIHLAAMAGTVHVLQRCFPGVDVSGDVLLLDTWWPGWLATLQFGILYRGHVVTVTIVGHTATVTSGPGSETPVTVRCHGQQRALGSGQSLRFTL